MSWSYASRRVTWQLSHDYVAGYRSHIADHACDPFCPKSVRPEADPVDAFGLSMLCCNSSFHYNYIDVTLYLFVG